MKVFPTFSIAMKYLHFGLKIAAGLIIGKVHFTMEKLESTENSK
jgi:hypothetical protein